VKHARLIGAAALIIVILTSTYAYGQLSLVRGSAPEQIPQLPALCQGGIDLSTGTNGATVGDIVGTYEASVVSSTFPAGRWVVSGSGITGTVPAISVKPVSGWYQTLPTVAPGGGPSGRINWISNGTTSTPGSLPGDTYTYSIQFDTTSLGPGTFNLIGFTADNSVQMHLTGPFTNNLYNSPLYPSTTATDFKSFKLAAPSTLNTPAPYTLTATVKNGMSTVSGLAVEAYFCPNISPPPLFPPGFIPKFEYAVKFICNTGTTASDASAAQGIGLEPGFYQTDINVHNPSTFKINEPIVKKFILAIPEDNKPPPYQQVVNAIPSAPNYAARWAILSPDAAIRLDCSEILAVLSVISPGINLRVAKGFVIIYSVDQLDVWVEYSAQNTSGFGVQTLEVVKVEPSPFVP
jgi:hypothetical protein